MSENMHIGLISCTEKKLATPAAAKDLYVGGSFTSGRSILERACDRWYILSASHGLVRPDARLEPYDESLDDMSTTQYGSWCERVTIEVLRMDPTELTIIAPDLYAGYVVTCAWNRGIKINRRPRVDIYSNGRWYMSCRQCGMCGPFHVHRDDAVDDAVGHPCRYNGGE